MPLPFFSTLPTTGSPAKSYVDQTSWDRLVDCLQNWVANVNGNGKTLSNVTIIPGSGGVSGSASLTFTTIPSGSYAGVDLSVAGALAGDAVIPGWPSTLEDGLIGMMFCYLPGVVRVRLFNATGSPITPAVQTFSATSGLGATPFRSASLSLPSIASGTVYVTTFTVAGANTGQKVIPAWPFDLEGGLIGMMRVSAVNTVEVRLINMTGGPITPVPHIFGATLFN